MTLSVARLVQEPRPRRGCQWIEGEAAGIRTVFCGLPTARGGSWCAAHRRRVFGGHGPATYTPPGQLARSTAGKF